MKTREYQYDNIRFLLMALVVLGHLLEIAGEFPHRELLYALIYSFHMPAFLFLSGMFARFDRAKWLFGMALPYLLLQWLYTAFVEKLGDPWVHVQFSRPYWILWYLFVLMVYTILLPVYDTPSHVKQGLMVAASVGLAPRLKGRIPVITVLGQNTLPIYLLHGFFFHLFRLKYPWLVAQPWQVLLVWAGLLLLLGNPVVGRCTNFLLRGGWYRLLQTRFTCGRSIAPGGKI